MVSIRNARRRFMEYRHFQREGLLSDDFKFEDFDEKMAKGLKEPYLIRKNQDYKKNNEYEFIRREGYYTKTLSSAEEVYTYFKKNKEVDMMDEEYDLCVLNYLVCKNNNKFQGEMTEYVKHLFDDYNVYDIILTVLKDKLKVDINHIMIESFHECNNKKYTELMNSKMVCLTIVEFNSMTSYFSYKLERTKDLIICALGINKSIFTQIITQYKKLRKLNKKPQYGKLLSNGRFIDSASINERPLQYYMDDCWKEYIDKINKNQVKQTLRKMYFNTMEKRKEFESKQYNKIKDLINMEHKISNYTIRKEITRITNVINDFNIKQLENSKPTDFNMNKSFLQKLYDNECTKIEQLIVWIENYGKNYQQGFKYDLLKLLILVKQERRKVKNMVKSGVQRETTVDNYNSRINTKKDVVSLFKIICKNNNRGLILD